MKKIVSILLSLLALSAAAVPASAAASAPPDIDARSCILIHAGDGTVLYQHNADTRMRIASTTKIMTAIVVLENCTLTDPVAIKAEYCGVEGSSMYLREGESYTVEELLYGMMLVSGNDAAVALACHTAGSVAAFAKLMNDKAAALGMTDSAFKNPNGLDEDGHYSTARDMAKLADYCMQNADFRALVSCKSRTMGGRDYVNHNKLLWQLKGCLGVKTGYTLSSGRSLVSCCQRGGTRYLCVTLGDPDDWADHAALYEWAFQNWSDRAVIDGRFALSLPVVSGKETAVGIAPECSVCRFLSAEDTVTYRIELPRFVFAPVQAGEDAGRITALVNGVPAASARLLYTGSVAVSPGAAVGAWARFSALGGSNYQYA